MFAATPTRRWTAILVLMLLIAGCVSRHEASAQAPAAKAVRVLAIGNSFSDNATVYLRALAEAAGHEAVVRRATIGGGSLQQHWRKVERLEADPDDPDARYKSGATLREMLVAEPWDYVTLQQYSWISHDPATHQPYADRLRDYVARYAPQAELLVHQTWAYRRDDPRFAPDAAPKPGHPRTQRAMYEGLTAAYDALAEQLDARVIPTGDAFWLADTDPARGFRDPGPVDPDAFEHPDTPDQRHSLHFGWRWIKASGGERRLHYDGHHANVAGRYLAACVWFEVLFDESVLDNPFVPDGLDPDYARFLRATAHRAVAARQSPAER